MNDTARVVRLQGCDNDHVHTVIFRTMRVEVPRDVFSERTTTKSVTTHWSRELSPHLVLPHDATILDFLLFL